MERVGSLLADRSLHPEILLLILMTTTICCAESFCHGQYIIMTPHGWRGEGGGRQIQENPIITLGRFCD